MSFTTHKTEAGQTRSHIIFPDSTKLLLHFNMTQKTEVGETRSSLPFQTITDLMVFSHIYNSSYNSCN